MKNNFTRMSESVLAIKTNFLFGTRLLTTHVFVLKTNAGLILFDTGSPGSGEMILKSIQAAGFDYKSIKAVCLSHWHRDHTGSLAEITERLCGDQSIDIFIGQADLPFLISHRTHTLRFHPVLNLPVLHSPGRMPEPSSARFFPLNNAGCETLKRKYGIKAIATPGHTPGHTAYLHQKTAALFSGCALSLLAPDIAGLVPIYHDRKKQIQSGEYLAGLNFRYLFPAHMFTRSDEIPLERRRPVTDKKGLASRLMGDHLFFQIS